MSQRPAPLQTGFPSPADDHAEAALELRDLIETHPEATFYMRARGDGLRHRGVNDGDTLVVDRSLAPRDDALAVAVVDGAIVLAMLRVEGGRVRALVGSSGELVDGDGGELWGCVAYVIRDHRRP